jgi:hypothetical protein
LPSPSEIATVHRGGGNGSSFGCSNCKASSAARIRRVIGWRARCDKSFARSRASFVRTRLRGHRVKAAALKPFFDAVWNHVIEHSRQRFLQPKAALLAQRVAPATAAPAMTAGFDVTVLPSLNFVNAGTEISLIGAPCVDTQCQDGFFEHHATTYYNLMQAQFQSA